MKLEFTVETKTLLKGLNYVTNAVAKEKNTPNTLLTGISFSVKGNILTIFATNEEIAIRTKVPLESVSDDLNISFVLNGDLIRNIVKKISNGFIHFTVDEHLRVKVENEGSNFTLTGLPTEGFPDFPEKKLNCNQFKIDERIFKNGLMAIIDSIAKKENIPILTGASFEITNDKLTIVGLDGYRMAKKSLQIQDVQENEDIKIIIPGTSLKELMKSLSDIEGKLITISYTSKQFFAESENYEFNSKLLEGQFINYNNIIPKDTPKTRILMKTEELISALEQQNILAKIGNNNLTRFQVNAEEKKLTISANAAEVGSSEQIVYLTEDPGEDIKIAFNLQFVLEMVKSVQPQSSEIEILLTTPVAPMTVKGQDKDGEFLYLVLPVRVTN